MIFVIFMIFRCFITKLRLVVKIAMAVLLCAGAARAETPPVRIAAMADPFAMALYRAPVAAEAAFGVPLAMTLLDYEGMRRAVAANAVRSTSRFDLVAVDILWLPAFVRAGVLARLDPLPASEAASFWGEALAAVRIDGHRYATPIQPHAELLFYRRSWFAEAGMSPPQTPTELLVAAAALLQARPGSGGVCWNAASGPALGQQLLHFAAAYGARLLRPDGRLSVAGEGWRSAMAFARALIRVSPPDISAMAWDRRVRRFADGRCALTFGWGARAAMLEAADAPARGDVGVMPPPTAPGARPATPMGVWTLAIPNNLSPARDAAAREALNALTSAEANHFFLDHGVAAGPRRLDGDTEAKATPAMRLTDRLEQQGLLSLWMRPPAMKLHEATEIIGVEAHAALFGSAGIDAALRRIQQRLAQLEGSGR